MAYHTRSFQASDILLIPPGACFCYCSRAYFEEELPLRCECGTSLRLRGEIPLTSLVSRDGSWDKFQKAMSDLQEFLSYQRRPS